MKPTRSLMLLMPLLWLAGCASSGPPAQRYTLPSSPAPDTAEAVSSTPDRTLVIESLELASYLDNEGIVLQRDDIRLHQASSHLWAEDLGRQLARGLRQRLTERLPDTRVLGASDEASLSLRIEVDQFQGRYDGLAVAGGRWQLRDASGTLLAVEPFTATAELDSDGYPALVRALGRSWDRVADLIAQRIEALP